MKKYMANCEYRLADNKEKSPGVFSHNLPPCQIPKTNRERHPICIYPEYDSKSCPVAVIATEEKSKR